MQRSATQSYWLVPEHVTAASNLLTRATTRALIATHSAAFSDKYILTMITLKLHYTSTALIHLVKTVNAFVVSL